jgi:hypothetical protein
MLAMGTKDTMGTKDIKVRLVFVSLVSFVAIGLVAYHWWPSPERAVKNRLGELAQTLSVPANDGDLGRVTRVAQLRHYFAEDVHVRASASGPEITSRDVLLGLLGGWTPPPGGWTIEFVDVQVTLGQESTTAQVYLTAKMSGHDAPTGEPTFDAREANVTIAKQHGDWVVTSVEATETLQRP